MSIYIVTWKYNDGYIDSNYNVKAFSTEEAAEIYAKSYKEQKGYGVVDVEEVEFEKESFLEGDQVIFLNEQGLVESGTVVVPDKQLPLQNREKLQSYPVFIKTNAGELVWENATKVMKVK
jgi:hypothetical protein